MEEDIYDKIFREVDKSNNGIITKTEIILAIRKNKNIAEALNLPRQIRQEDGSREIFMDSFNMAD